MIIHKEGINTFPTLKTDGVGNGFIRSAFQTLYSERDSFVN